MPIVEPSAKVFPVMIPALDCGVFSPTVMLSLLLACEGIASSALLQAVSVEVMNNRESNPLISGLDGLKLPPPR